jgi:hypothetical protein
MKTLCNNRREKEAEQKKIADELEQQYRYFADMKEAIRWCERGS